ncbi:MAG: family 20 glycosylhydrolase [Pyrinomonadaceae bacterium]|nr:family 20 glycosylhydrolase [Pyrinomonadaceae bacterium]
MKTRIVATDEAGRRSAGILNDLLLKNYGFKLEFTNKEQKENAIIFISKGFPVDKMPKEGYGLNIIPKGVLVYGNETGQFYAIQTLMQILPPDFKGEAKIPAVDIADEPRFGYRGMHLDVSRHFMPVSFVKKYIELMSQYKFNQFHWHLTDDQGWRIEIKKYPKLTGIGSKRSETQKEKNRDPYVGDGVPVSGFYTQEEIKDVVAFAKARKINVIPEIELPGHSSAALTAYPELGCKENYQYKVQTTWGIFKEVFCPTESTFKFLEDVLAETITLFPDSPYIHIGGDEVLKDFWKESAFVQELKAKENLKDEHEVQSYFIRRIEKFINSKGKKIIGWDEILEGGVAPNATIMSWRGEKGGIDAAKAKHDVIMTPNTFLYFDYGQGDPKTEPLNIGSFIPLEKVYSYDPIPKDLTEDEKKYILGAQANIWTEFLKNPENIEYMAFPRMIALAEVNWSPNERKNYTDFQQRLSAHFPKLDRQNVNYRIPAPEGLQNIVLSNESNAKIELKPTVANAKILYTLDGTAPDENGTEYKGAFEVSLAQNEKRELKTIVILPNKRKSSVYSATLLRRPPLEPFAKPLEKNNVVNFAFYKNSFKTVKELDVAEATESGMTKSISLQQFNDKTDKLKESFGVIFDGFLEIQADGLYEFEMDSDDGAVFIVGEEAIVDLDGLHGKMTASGIVPLKKGFYKVRLKYFQAGGDAVLNLRFGLKGQALRRLNGSEFYN